jgi:hypothetical protein
MVLEANTSSVIPGSTSIVNERVQMELEVLLDEFEEKKIEYGTQRREEIKRMEAEKAAEKKKIETSAK